MAVAFDAVSSAFQTACPTPPCNTTVSWTHTPVGTPSLVVVALSIGKDVGVTTATYGGTALTLIREDVGIQDGNTFLYRLISPPTGAQTVSLTIDSDEDIEGAAVTVTGSDTTTPISNSAGASGVDPTDPSVTVTSAAGELVIDVIGGKIAFVFTAGADQTKRWEENQVGAGSTEAGAASVTMSWTVTTGVGDGWVISAVSIKPAAAAGGWGRLLGATRNRLIHVPR